MLSRSTPKSVARQLRQEAGFGCCVCGIPIIQYHHIVEWAEDKHFRAEDMMVLCPNHHDQATKGAMPEADQRSLKARPCNIRKGLVGGHLKVTQDYCAANFGSVTVVGSGTFLRIGGEDILGFYLEDGNLQVSLRLFSETDELILEIDKNEWISGDPLPWDIEADWQTLTLRERKRHISVSLNAKTVPLEVRANFRRFGKEVIINQQGIRVGGKNPSGISELALVGMQLEVEMDLGGFKIGPGPGNPYATFVSDSNRRERLWKAKDIWRKMLAEK